MSMAEYMRNRRKKISVLRNGHLLKINMNEMLKINKILLIFNAEAFEKLLEIDIKALKINEPLLEINIKPLKINAPMLKFNASKPLKINAGMLKINAPENAKNGEISSKTPFSAVSCGQNSAQNGEGGLGGGVCSRTIVAVRKDNEVQNISNKEKDFSKNEKPKNQKQEFSLEEKKAYFEKLKIIAFPYWAVMPEECRKKSTFKKFFEVFNRIKASVPELCVYYGCLHNAKAGWNEGFFKAADKFLSGEPWLGLSAKEKADINRQKADFDRMAKALICKFNGEKK